MSFLRSKADNGWSRESVSTAAQALRSFFRHAERRGWCKPGIAAGIQGPKIYQYAGLPEGPTWDEVRRILQNSKGSSPAAIRARAILFQSSTIRDVAAGNAARVRGTVCT